MSHVTTRSMRTHVRKRSGIRRNASVTSDIADTDGGTTTEGDEDVVNASDFKPAPVDLRKVITRTVTASTLALLFLGLLQTGHFYCILSGVITQVKVSFRKLFGIKPISFNSIRQNYLENW